VPENEPSSHPLAYVPAPRRRRRVGRWVAVILLLMGVGAAWYWRTDLRDAAKVQYWQWQCGKYQPRADTVVANTKLRTAAPIPACWISYEASAMFIPNVRPAFYPRFAQTLAFLHRLRSAAGHERIVAVRCIVMYLPSASVLQAMQPVVVAPADAWPLSSRPVLVWEGPFQGGYPGSVDVQVLAGQSDPADPAHFTIAYTVEGKPGIIDGRLGDDDTVTLKVRTGSADVMQVFQSRASQIAHPQ
jgi:hypothetical protein